MRFIFDFIGLDMNRCGQFNGQSVGHNVLWQFNGIDGRVSRNGGIQTSCSQCCDDVCWRRVNIDIDRRPWTTIDLNFHF